MANLIEVTVPDIGDFKNIPVIEVFVKPGDTVKPEDPLVTLESDKSTMDVPSPVAGVVKEVTVKNGDKVSKGTRVLMLEPAEGGAPAKDKEAAAPAAKTATKAATKAAETPAAAAAAAKTTAAATETPAPTATAQPAAAAAAAAPMAPIDDARHRAAHASPSVRHFARELGVDLSLVKGTGPKERILREDVQGYVKGELAARGGAAAHAGGLGFNLPPLPEVDFAKFGEVESKPLARIRKLSGAFLHRNWLSIPHITQHDAADITELDAFRKVQAAEAQKDNIRLTPLAFLVKAAVAALKAFPEFNASLSGDGESLILKHYFNIGVAVDTPNGLVVPVLRDVDKKGVLDIARELGAVSERMRAGKINPADLQGGCFSISSLGGIGGTLFTPIINAPEVAILGVGKSAMKPVWDGKAFQPRLMLPLSLSYDHRVIDGAQGARFITYLNHVLSDIRRLVL